MRVTYVARWRIYVDWLSSGLLGVRPDELRWTLGPVWALLPMARQVAQTLGPWLEPLLAARQRSAPLALSGEEEQLLREAFAAETLARPFEGRQPQQSAAWLKWLLEAELGRLLRLAEAPEAVLYRQGWLSWEVRYWALAVSLARIGQVYAVLEQGQGIEQAQMLFKGALARVWRQAVRAEHVV